jgi:TonB family protein
MRLVRFSKTAVCAVFFTLLFSSLSLAADWSLDFQTRVVEATVSLLPAGLKAKLPADQADIRAAVQRAAQGSNKLSAAADRAKTALAGGDPAAALDAVAGLTLTFVNDTAPRADAGFFARVDRSPEIRVVFFDGYHRVLNVKAAGKKFAPVAGEAGEAAVAAVAAELSAGDDLARLFNLYVNFGVDLAVTAALDAGLDMGQGSGAGVRLSPPLNEADDGFRPGMDLDPAAGLKPTLDAAVADGVLKPETFVVAVDPAGDEDFVFDEGITVTGDEAQHTADQLANSDVHVDSRGVDRMKGLDEDALRSLAGIGVDVKKTRRAFRGTRGGVQPGQTVSVGSVDFQFDEMSTVAIESREERTVFMQITDSAMATGDSAGHLNQKVVAAVIGANVGGIKACFERRLREIPDLSGRVFVEFTIAVDGSVKDVKLIENTSGDAVFAECLARQVQRFRFPPPQGGEVAFVFPFIFEQSY